MDYTTLIERLLDGTITADEQVELDRLMNDSPVVAQEVRQLVAVERILRDAAYEEQQHSFVFRESVRTNLKESLGFGGTLTTANLNTPSQKVAPNQTNAKKYTTGLLALLLLGAATVYFLLPESDNPALTVSAPSTPAQTARPQPVAPDKSTTVPVPASQQQQEAQPNSIERTGTPETSPQSFRSTAPANAPVQPTDEIAQEKEVSGTVQAPSNKESQYRKLIDISIQKFQQQSSTPAVAAVTAKQIALLYEKLGETTLTRQYFDTARSFARQGAVRETEGEITGEYALFEQRTGNTAKASALATESLQIFRSLHSDHLESWEKVLQPLVRNR